MIVLRHVIGDELRRRRQDQGRTLRDVSAAAAVSRGYLSEVERGQKAASSELLAAICGALDVSLSDVLTSVTSQVAEQETVSAAVACAARLTRAAHGLLGADGGGLRACIRPELGSGHGRP